MRHQVMATDTPPGHGSIQYLEARHRAHARVEDRIRTGKDTGFGRFPSRVFAINQAWLELALVGIDLLAWTQTLLLDGELALAEPKKLRYRLLHVAARPTPSAPPPPPQPDDPGSVSPRPGPGQQPPPPHSPASPRYHAPASDIATA